MTTQLSWHASGDKRNETLLRDDVRARGYKVKTGLKAGRKTKRKVARKTKR